jgi:hypothetical protein
MNIWDKRILWKGKLRVKGYGLWHVTKTSKVIWIYRAFERSGTRPDWGICM